MPFAIVSGVLAGKAGNGGNAWSRVSIVLGLRRLGYDVVFFEQLERATPEQTAYFAHVCDAFGIEGYLLDGNAGAGAERAVDADVLLNIGGHLTLEPLRSLARSKVYLDDDPGYTQFWHSQGLLGDSIEAHDFHFTFGANIGRPGCAIPTNGVRWRATRPAVVLGEWPVAAAPDPARFTTVASWRGAYGPAEHAGRVFGQKAHEFRKFADVPRRCAQTLELALAIDPADAADLALLHSGGWHLVDPAAVAATPEEFRSYVQHSGGEFSVAQGVYVETGSGWFSDRSVRYLASGKPIVIQDTGLAGDLPVGEGLVVFRTPEEACAGLAAVADDYDRHARAARVLAEEFFDSDLVLGRLLAEVL